MPEQTKFNPTNIKMGEMTIGDCLSPIENIKTKEDAKQYFDAYVDYVVNYQKFKGTKSAKTPEEIVISNIMFFIVCEVKPELKSNLNNLFFGD